MKLPIHNSVLVKIYRFHKVYARLFFISLTLTSFIFLNEKSENFVSGFDKEILYAQREYDEVRKWDKSLYEKTSIGKENQKNDSEPKIPFLLNHSSYIGSVLIILILITTILFTLFIAALILNYKKKQIEKNIYYYVLREKIREIRRLTKDFN